MPRCSKIFAASGVVGPLAPSTISLALTLAAFAACFYVHVAQRGVEQEGDQCSDVTRAQQP